MLSIIAILVIIFLVFYYKDRINPLISKYVSASIAIPEVPVSITAMIPSASASMYNRAEDHTNAYRNIRMKENGASIEERMSGQHREYFTADEVGVRYANDDEKNVDNSTFAYGSKDADFSDYIKGQAIDKEVIDNHRKYMSEKKYSQGSIRFAPDMNESYNPIPWIGLRRPQAVPVGNPDQVPDVDKTYYNTPEDAQTWRF